MSQKQDDFNKVVAQKKLEKKVETLRSLLSVILDVVNKSFKSTNERIDTVNERLDCLNKENKELKGELG